MMGSTGESTRVEVGGLIVDFRTEGIPVVEAELLMLSNSVMTANFTKRGFLT